MRLRKYLFILINVLIVLVVIASYRESRKFVDPSDERFIPGEVWGMEEVTVNLVYDSTLSENAVKEVQDAIKSMPPDVIKAFVDNEWKIYVIPDASPPDINGYDREIVAGLCDFDSKIIQIKVLDEADEAMRGSYYSRTLHELSHFADSVYGNASGSDEFLNLFDSHKDDYIEYEFVGDEINEEMKAKMGLATANAAEMFACGMEDYIANTDYLRENYVDMYVFFKNMIDKGV